MLTTIEVSKVAGDKTEFVVGCEFQSKAHAEQVFKQIESGVPAEDARFILPNAAATNLVMTGNLRAILDFYSKRKKGRGAQWEITDLAEQIRAEVVEADPWTEQFFEEV